MLSLFTPKDLPKQIALIVLHVLLARLVVVFFGSNDVVGFLWLASGVALVAVLLGGYKYLPAVFFGVLCGYLLLDRSLSFSLIAALRHTTAVFLGIWLLKKEGCFDPALNKLGDFLRILALALGIGLFSALLMQLLAWIDAASFAGTHSFNQRWTGHALGIIVVMPLVLVWRQRPKDWVAAEAMLIIGLSFLVGQVVFLDWLHDSLGQIARGYWLFLFITWAAVRLGLHGTVLTLAIVATQGVLGAQLRSGFFANDIATTQLANYFFYIFTLSVVGMALTTYFTERKQGEMELLRSNSELEQFSYSISHDMRQPLRMISSYLQLLERSLANQLDSEKREYFDFAIDGAKRMDAMMLGLLEYSRIGRKGEPPAELESRDILDNALHFLKPAITEAQAEIRITGDWPTIVASPDETLRLLQNLIGNALKFRIAGRTPEITVNSKITGNAWCVDIADNGVGIQPEQIDRLFQVFQRLQSRAAYEGTGIGLALCRKIVEHHGGKLWVESSGEGQGCTFRFSMPIATKEKR